MGVGGGSSGTGGTASSGSWAGGGRGLATGATDGISGAVAMRVTAGIGPLRNWHMAASSGSGKRNGMQPVGLKSAAVNIGTAAAWGNKRRPFVLGGGRGGHMTGATGGALMGGNTMAEAGGWS